MLITIFPRRGNYLNFANTKPSSRFYGRLEEAHAIILPVYEQIRIGNTLPWGGGGGGGGGAELIRLLR